MRRGFQMVARIPYPVTVPKYFTFANEVATMPFLLSSEFPIVPEVYGYSPAPDNIETEYISMCFRESTRLIDIWFDLEDGDIISITRQLAELELKMMSITFLADGSLKIWKRWQGGRASPPREQASLRLVWQEITARRGSRTNVSRSTPFFIITPLN